jgi:hypothetical protein
MKNRKKTLISIEEISTEREIAEKTCCRCHITKSIDKFAFKNKKRNNFKRKASCNECQNMESRNRYHRTKKIRLEVIKKWRKNNPEKCRAADRKYKKKHPEKMLEQYYSNKPKRMESRARYTKRWPERNRERANRYRANKLRAMPKWLTFEHKKEIKNIYSNCPKGQVVDHIVPLKEKIVCGLHVPWNLQYLGFIENIKKGNKFNG